MKVLGGSYRETCEVPESDEVAGSGLRAAGAVAAVATPTLHTAVDDALRSRRRDGRGRPSRSP